MTIQPGDDLPSDDYTPASLERATHSREPVPHREKTRRAILGALGLAFVALFAVHVILAAALSDETWGRVGSALSSLSAVLGAGAGYVFGHYLGGRG